MRIKSVLAAGWVFAALLGFAGERTSFDFDWKFKYFGRDVPDVGSAVPEAAKPNYNEADFKSVQLPHDWAIESPFLADEPNETGKLPWNGHGWYRKTFKVSRFNRDHDRYFIDFEGVMAQPKVYINGEKAGEWAYGYASFRIDATPFLKEGENLIAVMASNRPSSTRWYPGAGVYRHVWLEKTDVVHLANWGVYVTTPEIKSSSAKVRVVTTVDNEGTRDKTLTVTQTVGNKTTSGELKVAAGKSAEIEQFLTLSNPRLWSVDEPKLYKLETVVAEGKKEIDSKTTVFGVRTIEWRVDGFYLNGKRLQLNGVCEHHDLGPLGSAFYRRGYERKIRKLKAMGCNSIRMTHNPPAPEVLDLCDRMGIVVIDELFDIWKYQKYDKYNGYHRYWPEWWKKDVRNFVLRDRNHPCVIAWSGGNEISEITAPDGVQISNDLRAEFKKYDTTRPYTVGTNASQGMDNGFQNTEDVFGFNYKPHLYKRFHEVNPKKPLYGSETASAVATRDTYFFPMGWGGGSGQQNFQVSSWGTSAVPWGYWPDTEFAAQKNNYPKVAGEYVWTGFDYIGEPTPYNQDRSNAGNFKDLPEAEMKKMMEQLEKTGNKAPSRSSYFGIIDLAGFPKDTYYLYQSVWAPEVKQAHILPHWNWKGREGQVTPVMVYSSGDEAELFLNGKSMGVKKRGEGAHSEFRFFWDNVKYEPGKLEVKVRKGGKPWAEAKRVTAGETASIVATDVDRKTLKGNGRDLAYIELATVDKDGNIVPTDCREVVFKVEGDAAKLIGFCNGNPIDWTCMQDMRQKFFNGRIVAVLRGEKGAKGKATVVVGSKGLKPLKLEFEVE